MYKLFLLFTCLIVTTELFAMSDRELKNILANDSIFCVKKDYSLDVSFLNHKEDLISKSKYINHLEHDQRKCIQLKSSHRIVFLEKDECDAKWIICPKKKDYDRIEYLFSTNHYPPYNPHMYTNYLGLGSYKKHYNNDAFTKLEKLRKSITSMEQRSNYRKKFSLFKASKIRSSI